VFILFKSKRNGLIVNTVACDISKALQRISNQSDEMLTGYHLIVDVSDYNPFDVTDTRIENRYERLFGPGDLCFHLSDVNEVIATQNQLLFNGYFGMDTDWISLNPEAISGARIIFQPDLALMNNTQEREITSNGFDIEKLRYLVWSM